MNAGPIERYLDALAARGDATKDTPSSPFAARHVADVMTRDVWTAPLGTPFKTVAQLLDTNRVHGVPVVDSDNRVVGVVTASDLLARVARTDHSLPRGHRIGGHHAIVAKRHGETAGEIMTAPPVTVTPNTTIGEAARCAAHSRVRTLPVVDANGRLVGIVTRDDLIRVFLRPDEDIRRDVERDVVAELPALPTNKVQVEVADGVVTLRGMVTTALTAARLAGHTRKVPGVVEVHEELEYDYDDGFTSAAYW